MRRIAVGDVMTRDFIFVKPDESVYDCAKAIVKKKVNTLPLVNKNRLLGIVNARDILWVIVKQPSANLKKLKAIDIAIRKVAVIKPSADIVQALGKMKAYNLRALPVITNGEIIGMLTLKDILRVAPQLYQELGELADIKEEERKLRDSNVEWPLEGFCDNCGAFSDLLKVYDQLLCYDCREELY